MKIIIKSNYEIVKLENEVFIFELSLEWSRDDHKIRVVL
jgi:hypothetical protein